MSMPGCEGRGGGGGAVGGARARPRAQRGPRPVPRARWPVPGGGAALAPVSPAPLRTGHLLHRAHARHDRAVLGELGGGGRDKGARGAASGVLYNCRSRLRAGRLQAPPTWLAPSASVTDSTVGIAMGMPPTMMTSRLVRVGHMPGGWGGVDDGRVGRQAGGRGHGQAAPETGGRLTLAPPAAGPLNGPAQRASCPQTRPLPRTRPQLAGVAVEAELHAQLHHEPAADGDEADGADLRHDLGWGGGGVVGGVGWGGVGVGGGAFASAAPSLLPRGARRRGRPPPPPHPHPPTYLGNVGDVVGGGDQRRSAAEEGVDAWIGRVGRRRGASRALLSSQEQTPLRHHQGGLLAPASHPATPTKTHPTHTHPSRKRGSGAPPPCRSTHCRRRPP
jgi:hypothetical protein